MNQYTWAKKIIYFVLLSFYLSNPVNAQFGINGMYNIEFQNENWDQWISDNDNSGDYQKLVPNSYGISIDYWFRLKNYRIEFLPELNFSVGMKNINYLDGTIGNNDWKQLAFQLNTNFYILNIEGDCNCPTFGKQDPFLKKGFYIQMSPGLEIINSTLQKEMELESNNFSQLIPFITIGLGVDIGISEFITITPWVRRKLSYKTSWDTLSEYVSNTISTENNTYLNTMILGFRVGYRYDYKKRY